MSGKLWERRSVGKPPSFKSPEEMWDRAVEYFEWCEINSIEADKVFCFQGEVIHGGEKKMRAMTQHGLCCFLNISVATWHNYKAKDEYLEVTGQIEEIMYEQKFSGAAAGVLSSNIIARDLGLTDKHEVTSVGGETTPWSSIGKSDE